MEVTVLFVPGFSSRYCFVKDMYTAVYVCVCVCEWACECPSFSQLLFSFNLHSSGRCGMVPSNPEWHTHKRTHTDTHSKDPLSLHTERSWVSHQEVNCVCACVCSCAFFLPTQCTLDSSDLNILMHMAMCTVKTISNWGLEWVVVLYVWGQRPASCWPVCHKPAWRPCRLHSEHCDPDKGFCLSWGLYAIEADECLAS